MAAVIAVKPDQVPMARPRPSSGYEALMMARLPGNQECRSYPLKSARDDEGSDGGGEAAPGRSNGKQQYAEEEDFTTAIEIAERATQQQQRGKQKSVGLDHPLNVRHRCMKSSLQSGQCYVDDGPVDKRHAGSENRRNQDPRSSAWLVLRRERRELPIPHTEI